MINFFKKLFAAIFGTKKKYSVPTDAVKTKPAIVEQPIVVLDEMKMPKETSLPNQVAGTTKKSKPTQEKIFGPLGEMKIIKEAPWPKTKFFPSKGIKEWQMKHNRLHIEYNGQSPSSGSNYCVDKDENKTIIKVHTPGSMYKGKIDSLRCNKLERAKEILRPFRSYVQRAVFTDRYGNQYQLI